MTTEKAIEKLNASRITHIGVSTDISIGDAFRWNEAIEMAIYALHKQQEAEKSPGEISDGYHSFNELYHHRAVLFSVICNDHPELAWKSKQHHDPADPMYDGMFIVGIETPDGQATYHYDIYPYWDMFHVKELERAPEWDGHSPAQAIERIGRLAKKNEPLMLDELRNMDGQPIWAVLEIDGMSQIHSYAIVDSECECVKGLKCFLLFDDYGSWFAYRTPPEDTQQ